MILDLDPIRRQSVSNRCRGCLDQQIISWIALLDDLTWIDPFHLIAVQIHLGHMWIRREEMISTQKIPYDIRNSETPIRYLISHGLDRCAMPGVHIDLLRLF